MYRLDHLRDGSGVVFVLHRYPKSETDMERLVEVGFQEAIVWLRGLVQGRALGDMSPVELDSLAEWIADGGDRRLYGLRFESLEPPISVSPSNRILVIEFGKRDGELRPVNFFTFGAVKARE